MSDLCKLGWAMARFVWSLWRLCVVLLGCAVVIGVSLGWLEVSCLICDTIESSAPDDGDIDGQWED